MTQRVSICTALFLICVLIRVLTRCANSQTSGSLQGNTQNIAAQPTAIQAEEHYALRDGLRIYLWKKHKLLPKATFAEHLKVALLVHGGTWSGRPDFDVQIRDYSLMDFLAKNDYDVWAIDIHGYGHSDKTEKDWSDARSAAADSFRSVTNSSRFAVERQPQFLRPVDSNEQHSPDGHVQEHKRACLEHRAPHFERNQYNGF